jgi:hypothetical protein
MSIPEFKSAERVKYEDWESTHNRRFTDVLRLFDVAMVQARESSPEGWGFTAEACIQGFELRLTVTPPVKPEVPEGKGGSATAFSRDRVQAVVMENPDLLSLKEEGGAVTVSTKRYLDKEWDSISSRLREAGMKYVRENKRWEQA